MVQLGLLRTRTILLLVFAVQLDTEPFRVNCRNYYNSSRNICEQTNHKKFRLGALAIVYPEFALRIVSS